MKEYFVIQDGQQKMLREMPRTLANYMSSKGLEMVGILYRREAA
jgi:hypothetical protein